MKSISIPFRFENGKVATTTDNATIARQRIADVLTTRPFERVMIPEYGAAISNLLFEPLDPLVFADYRIDATTTLNNHVSNAYIRDLQVRAGNQAQYGEEGDSTLDVRVLYDVAGQGTLVYNFTVNQTQILTEETPI